MKVLRVLLSVLVLFGFLAAVRPAQAAPTTTLMIVAFTYQDVPGGEFVEIKNVSAATILGTDLDDYRVGDASASGEAEGMLFLPTVDLAAGDSLVLAVTPGSWPLAYTRAYDYGFGSLTPDLAWGTGTFDLDDAGDEILILDNADNPVDYVCYGTSPCTFEGFPDLGGLFWTGAAIPDAAGNPGYTRSADTDAAADFAPNPTAIELKDLTTASSGRIYTAVLVGAAALVFAGGTALFLRKRSR